MKIAGLHKVGLIDYPEHIAATVFLAGCNLDCGYCYNRWMIREAEAPAVLSSHDLLDWLVTRRGLLDGVCVSGGEPTVHPDLPALLRDIKELGFAVKLDTNGTRPDVLAALLDAALLDFVALDLKAPLDERYSRVTRRPVDAGLIRRSMALLRRSGVGYEYRTTVGPELAEVDLLDLSREIAPGERWMLQAFVATPHVAPDLAGAPALGQGALAALAARLRDVAAGVEVRGAE